MAITTLADLDGTPHADVFDDHRPRTVRLALDAGEAVPRHTHPAIEIGSARSLSSACGPHRLDGSNAAADRPPS
jgi:anti-sigma factor ChrR (cupin superfamily)